MMISSCTSVIRVLLLWISCSIKRSRAAGRSRVQGYARNTMARPRAWEARRGRDGELGAAARARRIPRGPGVRGQRVPGPRPEPGADGAGRRGEGELADPEGRAAGRGAQGRALPRGTRGAEGRPPADRDVVRRRLRPSGRPGR